MQWHRLYRPAHCLSFVFQQPQIDHRIAVKEYSRSSADQEEPLPLELRPVHALTRTMEYLCNNILGIGSDGGWSDWYDFLWSRTRAIRKVRCTLLRTVAVSWLCTYLLLVFEKLLVLLQQFIQTFGIMCCVHFVSIFALHLHFVCTFHLLYVLYQYGMGY